MLKHNLVLIKKIIYNLTILVSWLICSQAFPQSDFFSEPKQITPSSPSNARIEDFALSNDGKWAVYLESITGAGDNNETRYSIKSVSTNGGNQISLFSRDEIMYRPTISNDSKYVVFETNSNIWVVPISGGTARGLNVVLPVSGRFGRIYGYKLSPDGKRIVYLAERRDFSDFELISEPLSGGPIVRLDTISYSNSFIRSFQISPDSRSVFYLISFSNRAEIYKTPIDAGTPVSLNVNFHTTEPWKSVDSQFQLSNDGTKVVYSVRGESGTDWYSVDVNDRTPIRLTPTTLDSIESELLITADSQRVIYYQSDNRLTRIFTNRISSDVQTVLYSKARTAIQNFKLTSDNKKVIFQAVEAGPYLTDFYSLPVVGGQLIRLNTARIKDQPFGSPDFYYNNIEITPNSQNVLFLAEQPNSGANVIGLYRASINGTVYKALNPSIQPNGDIVNNFKITPDSRLSIFMGDINNDNVFELYGAPIIGGSSERINTRLPNGSQGISKFKLNPKGSHLVYQARHRTTGKRDELFSVSIFPSEEVPSAKSNNLCIPCIYLLLE